jgi:ATP-dependent protease ClpP protease subunit
MRIEMRGVIVPSFYDSEWAQKYIDKGLMIPESAFRRMLAEAPKDEPLEVYVNSPGGSVFAAYEMINAVREWKAETGQKAEVTIGAMAASAASAFAVMAGSSIKAHRNAKMMFHGATTDAWGGKDALEDTADLIGKINADIQNVLIQKYGMDSDVVAEWFEEGRQGWLSADEMVDAGIVSEVIADDADAIVFDDGSVAAIEENGLQIAAVLELTNEEENECDDAAADSADDEPEEEATEYNIEDVSGDTGNGSVEFGPDGEPVDIIEPEQPDDYSRGLADGLAQARAELAGEYAERIATYEQDLSNAREDARKYQSEKDKLSAKIQQVESDADARAAALREKLDEATARIRKHIDGALTFEAEPLTWEQAVDMCGGYANAKKKYPELCDKFKSEKGAK